MLHRRSFRTRNECLSYNIDISPLRALAWHFRILQPFSDFSRALGAWANSLHSAVRATVPGASRLVTVSRRLDLPCSDVRFQDQVLDWVLRNFSLMFGLLGLWCDQTCSWSGSDL